MLGSRGRGHTHAMKTDISDELATALNNFPLYERGFVSPPPPATAKQHVDHEPQHTAHDITFTSGLPLQTTQASQDINDTDHPSCATAPLGLVPRLATTKRLEVNHVATTESTPTFEFPICGDMTRTTTGNDNNAQSVHAGKQDAKGKRLRVYFSLCR